MSEMSIPSAGARTDRDLARAVSRRRDEQAFRELYRRHTPRLLGFVHRLLGPAAGAVAEDLVQEAWIRACQNLKRFRWDSSFSTWLMGIGLNVVRERQRHDAQRAAEPLEYEPRTGSATRWNEERIDLARAIELLPDGYRLALVLHDIEGMKHTEIAKRLKISSGTSKSQLFGARKAMRALLRRPTEVRHGGSRTDAV
jgi:RNA polymerase sigma-70 factor (ECF subfamily)